METKFHRVMHEIATIHRAREAPFKPASEFGRNEVSVPDWRKTR
jgi:hypothetical protein